ncbi:MAG: hypothetical protein WCX14_00385 [Dysgonamonadaceae bacterium]
MNEKNNILKSSEKRIENKKEKDLLGYPLYPDSEDIYKKAKEETDLNPEDTSKTKASNSTNALRRKELDTDTELSGEDLDIPGSELDDAEETIGNEDEENNYYSLGGDDHDDLEEDKGNLD